MMTLRELVTRVGRIIENEPILGEIVADLVISLPEGRFLVDVVRPVGSAQDALVTKMLAQV